MRRKLLISAVLTLRNAVLLGYPFVESILSVLPVCDEFVIVEGYSDDETYAWLERLQKKYPEKIVLSRERWPVGVRSGHAIGLMQTAALKKCRGKWVFLVQADEIVPEEDVRPLRELCDPLLLVRRVRQPPAPSRTDSAGLSVPSADTTHLPVPPDAAANARDRRYSRDLARMRKQDALLSLFAGSYHLDFVHWVAVGGHLHFQHLSYRWATRLARNRPGLYSGSDGWLLQGPGCFPMGTARLPHPILHLPSTFPVNAWRKVINHAALYPDLAVLQEQAQDAQEKLDRYASGLLPAAGIAPPFHLPALIAPLIGWPEYRVRPELLE